MEKNNLGLAPSKIELIEYLSSSIPSVTRVRFEVFTSQKKNISSAEEIITKLNQKYRECETATDSFSKALENRQKNDIENGIRYVEDYLRLEKQLDTCVSSIKSVYVPDVIENGFRSNRQRETELNVYLKFSQTYLDLCKLARDIEQFGASTPIDYYNSDKLLKRYNEFIPEIKAKLQKNLVQDLNSYYNTSISLTKFDDKLSSCYSFFTILSQSVQKGRYGFSYEQYAAIKKDFDTFHEYENRCNDLEQYIGKMSAEDRNLAIGDSPYARSNRNLEYVKVKEGLNNVQSIIENGREFFAAAAVCSTIEDLNNNKTRSQKDVERVLDMYEKLSETAKSYVGSKRVSLIYSMLDSSKLVGSFENMLTDAETLYRNLTQDVKNGEPAYTFDKYKTVIQNIGKGEEWLIKIETLTSTIKDIKKSSTLEPSKENKYKALLASTDKVKKSVELRACIDQAHDFEVEVDDFYRTAKKLKSFDSEKLDAFDKKYKKLSQNVKSFIPDDCTKKIKDLTTIEQKQKGFVDATAKLKKDIAKYIEDSEKYCDVEKYITHVDGNGKDNGRKIDFTDFSNTNRTLYDCADEQITAVTKFNKQYSDFKVSTEEFEAIKMQLDERLKVETLYQKLSPVMERYINLKGIDIKKCSSYILRDYTRTYSNCDKEARALDKNEVLKELFDQIVKLNKDRAITKRVLFFGANVLILAVFAVAAIVVAKNGRWDWPFVAIPAVAGILLFLGIVFENAVMNTIAVIMYIGTIGTWCTFLFRDLKWKHWAGFFPVTIFFAAITLAMILKFVFDLDEVFMGFMIGAVVVMIFIAAVVALSTGVGFAKGNTVIHSSMWIAQGLNFIMGLAVGVFKVVMMVIGGIFWWPSLFGASAWVSVQCFGIYCSGATALILATTDEL